MSILDIIYSILIGPLQLVFEIIYTIANRFIGHSGLAIIILSLIMNFLVLPLYKRSDAMQEEARDTEARLSKGVEQIKKVFRGDERMMILQTYYRQNNYKPTDALNGSVSLLLEVPFFMAAYNFLSTLQTIQGVSLGPIADLGAPDGMLILGGMTINLLPIFMTLINIISSAIYLKGFPLKTKIQLYGMALFFLVFLYTSPAGLVFYWSLNNLFSLVKTIFYKFKIKLNFGSHYVQTQNDKKIFILGGMFLTVLVGLLIPSTIIAASPQEFVDITYFYNPSWYVVHSLCLAAGTFLVWMGVFYWIASPIGKAIFDKLVWILCGIMLVNYMFFGTDLGILLPNLQYENGMDFGMKDILMNMIVLLVVAAVMYVIMLKAKKQLASVLLTAVIATAGMSVLNMYTIHTAVEETQVQAEAISASMPQFNLSKTGKNVIVLMLDRGMGEYIPYLMNEKPELKEQFAGFTYYSNVVSFGGFTNFGAPALFGGYEYTPVEMNKRNQERNVHKHNEALLMMPVLFSQNDYEVTVCDPTYANYQWIPDLSIYAAYPEIDAYITEGRFEDTTSKEYKIENNLRNFFCFSIMKTMPLVLQETIYEGGNYNKAALDVESVVYSEQILQSDTVATGMNSAFMNAYNVLVNLPNMTNITEEETNTFLTLTNNTTHEPMLLQEPEYVPSQEVDNTQYYAEDNQERFVVNNVKLKMEDSMHMSHYQTNMAVMLQLGKWFDYMRENDVYDNTRIIIASDHGRHVWQIDELVYDESIETFGDLEIFYPLLLVKDFDSKEFITSDEFMTQADIPTIAVENIIENPVNPFTGKEINNDYKYTQDLYVLASADVTVSKNNGYQFLPDKWYKVSDNIWNIANWKLIDVETTDPEAFD